MTHGLKLSWKSVAVAAGFLLIAVLFVMPRSVRAEEKSGNYKSIYWSFSDGALDVYGSGAMDDGLRMVWYSEVGLENIRSLVIHDGISKIDKYGLMNLNNLQSVSIPDTVTSIGDEAFENCMNLTSVVLPNSVTSIGTAAFKLCDALETVVLPNSIDEIPDSLFESCVALTAVNIPESVTKIGNQSFYSCSSLNELRINNSSVTIGDAFNNTSGTSGMTLYYNGSKASATHNGTLKKIVTLAGDNAEFTKYRITYFVDGSVDNYVEIDIEAGAKFTKPADPSKDDELFKGWWVADSDGYAIGDVYYDFDTVVTDDVYVVANFVEDVNKIEGISLSLTGDIEVVFKVSTKADAKTVMLECEIPGKNNNTVTYPANSEDDTYSIHVAPSAMTCPINLYVDSFCLTGDGITVRDYAAVIIANEDNNADYAAAHDLVVAMVNYGAYSQKHFGVMTSDLANDISGVTDNIPSSTVEGREVVITKRQTITDLDAFPFKYYGSSLILNDVTTAYVYFRYPDSVNLDEYYFQVNGQDVTPKSAGQNYICFSKEITAKDLDNSEGFVVSIDRKSGTGDAEGLNYGYCPTVYSYAVSQSTDPSVTDSLRNMSKAMYLYALETAKYN